MESEMIGYTSCTIDSEILELLRKMGARPVDSTSATSSGILITSASSNSAILGVNDGYWWNQDETPAHDPVSFLAQKQKRIARQQIDQRNDRIKAWEDKRKRFK